MTTLVTASVAASPVGADQGMSRDPAFGDGGRVVVADALASVGRYAITAQLDGRILVAIGNGPDATFVRRYESDGSIDTSFGTDGDIVIPPMLTAVWMPRDPQQPIFVVLATEVENVYRIQRYESDGSLDESFGSAGEAEFSFPSGYNGISILADASGRVTLASPNHMYDTDTTRLYQFDPNGHLEQNFGTDGVAVLENAYAGIAGVDSLGRIVIVAVPSQSFQPVVGRLATDGSLDPTFGDGGYASLVGNLDATAAVVTDDDGVAVAARDYYQGELTVSVQHLTADGDADLDFGDDGVVRVPFLDLQPNIANTEEFASPGSIVDHGGGRLAVLGNSFGAGFTFVLNGDGSFDDSFGQGGRAVLSVRMTMLAGSIEADGAVDFLGYDEYTPIFMQRSIPGSPWPPLAPAPQNLVAQESPPGTISATWSPVVNPDPEVTEYGYYYEVTPYPFSGSNRYFTTDTSGGLAPMPPGTYTFTVWSANSYADGLKSSTTVTIADPEPPPPDPEPPPPDPEPPPSTPPTPTPGAASEFSPILPARLMDTRPGYETIDGQASGTGERLAGTTTELQVAGRGGIATNVAAVALNVTITEPADPGFVTVYPCGGQRPNASNVNFTAHQTIANAVIAKPAGGKVCVYTSAPTHVVVDATGYYKPTSELVPLTPARLMDTRDGYATIDGAQNAGGRVIGGMSAALLVIGRGGVGTAPSAVILNVTVTQPTAPGFVTVYPCGTARPLASNINFVTGQTIANAVIAKTGNFGVCVYSSTTTHLVVDVAGYYPSQSSFTSLTPARLLDSRARQSTVDGRFSGIGPRAAGSTTELDVGHRGGVESDATAAALTVTVTEPVLPGFVTVYPCGSPRPRASTVNFAAHQTIANAVLIQPSSDGRVCLYTSVTTHLVVDVDGFYN